MAPSLKPVPSYSMCVSKHVEKERERKAEDAGAPRRGRRAKAAQSVEGAQIVVNGGKW